MARFSVMKADMFRTKVNFLYDFMSSYRIELEFYEISCMCSMAFFV